MASLEQFGIIPSSTTSPALLEERYRFGHDVYTEQAFEVLHRVSDFTATEVPYTLDTFISRWHPSGFMIYQLGTVPGLGMLRLHVWPDTERKQEQKGDTIHDHAWHVVSLVLKGVYTDALFEVDKEDSISEEDRKIKGLLRLFEASYKPDTSQELSTGGTCVRAIPSAERIVHEGEVHAIEPSVFHQPTIATAEATVTLVLNSFRTHDYGPYVLIDGPAVPIPEIRQSLTEDDLAVTKQILIR